MFVYAGINDKLNKSMPFVNAIPAFFFNPDSALDFVANENDTK